MTVGELKEVMHEEQTLEIVEQYTADTRYKGKAKEIHSGLYKREVSYMKAHREEIMIVVKQEGR